MATVGDLMRHCRNYFEDDFIDGDFEITQNGEIMHGGEALSVDGYIAIQDSRHNNGVHSMTDGALPENSFVAESFCGRIWRLSPPKVFIDLAEKCAAFEQKNVIGAMESESFGGYSYKRATGKTGGALTWQEAFAVDLKPFMRMFPRVRI